MFRREIDMAPTVRRWLTSEDLRVRSEFVTPWGICDFAAIGFNDANVACRLKHSQSKRVSSVSRAAILLSIPDFDTRQSTTIEELVAQFSPFMPNESVQSEVRQLIADRFAVVSSKGRVQKVNGWHPLQDRMVAVELKLSRIEEAMQQARNNLGFATESFAAFPMQTARRIEESPDRWAAHIESGVGVIGVLKRRCEVVIPSTAASICRDEAIQLYCADKFWRSPFPIKGS